MTLTPTISKLLVQCLLSLVILSSPLFADRVHFSPTHISFNGPEETVQIRVWATQSDAPDTDLTRNVDFEIKDQAVAVVSSDGRVRPVSEGTTQLILRATGEDLQIPVVVTGIQNPLPVSFQHDVIPVLTKAGCNSGGCHGKAEGQNGFKLSVFGFDAESDHAALTKESRGRRVRPTAPEQSLLLLKATGRSPHGGGRQLTENSPQYQRILRWVREGARLIDDENSRVVSLAVEPEEQLLALNGTTQLRVLAKRSDGTIQDVTAETQFESNAASIANVDELGFVKGGEAPGEAGILVRYMDQVAVSRIRMPRRNVKFQRPPSHNFIDDLVWNKLEQMGIQPSPICDDATFLRRAYLDVIGTLPTPDETKSFLDNNAPHKRSKLIDELLAREEYSLYWSLLWSDLLRVDANALPAESAVAVTRWLQDQFKTNRPYDGFVRDVLTVVGSTQAQGPAAVYLTLKTPEERANAMSQLFLGVRIECAQCHHHPFERWSQKDFAGFAGFFTGIKQKKLPNGVESIMVSAGSDLKHPRTGEDVPAAGLGAPAAIVDSDATTDRREILANWMTSKSNPMFAKSLVNRIWAHYLGRGLVEPIDDLRATNPATNEPLLNALATHFQDVNYDIKELTRTIMSSRVYQLSSQTNSTNAEDDQNFSHGHYRALPAEVLLDAICQVTEVPEKFNGWPVGARAIEVWDNRMPSYFFRVFGRPGRTTVCSCERSNAPTIAQALHLMNSSEITDKVQYRDGRARRLAESKQTPQEIVEHLYLTILNRYPTEAEEKLVIRAFEDADRRTATEDVMWVLLNSKDFLFNH